MKVIYEFDADKNDEDHYTLKIYQNAEKYHSALHHLQYSILRNFDKYEEASEDPNARIEQFQRLLEKIKEEVFDCDVD